MAEPQVTGSIVTAWH